MPPDPAPLPDPCPAPPPARWSIVLPFFNEEGFIADTLRCAMALDGMSAGCPVRLILVDNASTDATAALCRAVLADAPGLDVRYLHEARPGPVHALAAGFAAVDTPLVALWNADTLYPPDYLARAERLLAAPGVVAAMAAGVAPDPRSASGRLRRWKVFCASLLFPRQAHTGTFGQCFRTAALRAVGGPRSDRWPWVLDDHELMQRVFGAGGKSRYHPGFWCRPSSRRRSAAHVRWTLAERALYHATPFRAKDWFFYRFLAPRFRARGMASGNLRIRDWPCAAACDPADREV